MAQTSVYQGWILNELEHAGGRVVCKNQTEFLRKILQHSKHTDSSFPSAYTALRELIHKKKVRKISHGEYELVNGGLQNRTIVHEKQEERATPPQGMFEIFFCFVRKIVANHMLFQQRMENVEKTLSLLREKIESLSGLRENMEVLQKQAREMSEFLETVQADFKPLQSFEQEFRGAYKDLLVMLEALETPHNGSAEGEEDELSDDSPGTYSDTDSP